MTDVCRILVAKRNGDELRRTRVRKWEVGAEGDLKEMSVRAYMRTGCSGGSLLKTVVKFRAP